VPDLRYAVGDEVPVRGTFQLESTWSAGEPPKRAADINIGTLGIGELR